MNYYSNRNNWVIHDKIPNYKLVKDASYSWDAMISNNHLKKRSVILEQVINSLHSWLMGEEVLKIGHI